jgi:hypothetical protein
MFLLILRHSSPSCPYCVSPQKATDSVVGRSLECLGAASPEECRKSALPRPSASGSPLPWRRCYARPCAPSACSSAVPGLLQVSGDGTQAEAGRACVSRIPLTSAFFLPCRCALPGREPWRRPAIPGPHTHHSAAEGAAGRRLRGNGALQPIPPR